MSESYQQELLRLKLYGKTVAPKKQYTIPKKSKKRIEQEAKEKITGKPATKLELEVWFDEIAKKEMSYGVALCSECKATILPQYIRHATAHLLPKKIFKSVATHPLNYLILGAGCGCHAKTDRVDKFVQMKVWPEAARRIKEMIPLLPFDELKYLSSQLMTALENTP